MTNAWVLLGSDFSSEPANSSQTLVRNMHEFESQLHSLMEPMRGKKLLLGVSGGADSVAMACGLMKFQKSYELSFEIGYFHHGLIGDKANQIQTASQVYRTAAMNFVQDLATTLDIPFYSNFINLESDIKNSQVSVKSPESEAELRKKRRVWLFELKKKKKFDRLVFAHHREDLLETRLIRLIRGTGGQGLAAMKLDNGEIWRPLLFISKKVLESYLSFKGINWIDDPSNLSTEPLRNWIRQEWLPELEAKRPGAVVSMARSLELICQDLESTEQKIEFSDYITNKSLLRSRLLELGSKDQQRVVAYYMHALGLPNYSLSHVNEVLKRLNTEQKQFEFRVAGGHWLVSNNAIILTPTTCS